MVPSGKKYALLFANHSTKKNSSAASPSGSKLFNSTRLVFAIKCKELKAFKVELTKITYVKRIFLFIKEVLIT